MKCVSDLYITVTLKCVSDVYITVTLKCVSDIETAVFLNMFVGPDLSMYWVRALLYYTELPSPYITSDELMVFANVKKKTVCLYGTHALPIYSISETKK